MKIVKIFFLFHFILLTVQQYQHCFHLSGEFEDGTWANNYNFVSGTAQNYDASLGERFGAESFLIENGDYVLIFFGQINSYRKTNHILKFSTTDEKFQFISKDDGYNQLPVLSQERGDTEIGARLYTKGFMFQNERRFLFFGGRAIIKQNVGKTEVYTTNELWEYDALYNNYTDHHYNYYFTSEENVGQTNLDETTDDKPKPRFMHGFIGINDHQALLIGGREYNVFSNGFSDYWILSSTDMQWKKIGNQIPVNELIEDKFLYNPSYNSTNVIGGRASFACIKVNEEEILIFGGYFNNGIVHRSYSNIMQMYNITSNMWKYVSGDYLKDIYTTSFDRNYNSSNIVSGRSEAGIWKVSENELLIFAGYGVQTEENIYGFLNDEYRYNLDSKLFRFTGQESTKYLNRYSNYNLDNSYSENTLFGGCRSFSSAYIEAKKTLYIFGGRGLNLFEEDYLDDTYKVFYGNMCNLKPETDQDVCSGKGICSGYNTCNCLEGSFGTNCELSRCNGIFSNESDVCSGNGICQNGKCTCFTLNFDSFYEDGFCG